MAQNEFYRLDLVVGATGDVQVKEKLGAMDRYIEQTRRRGEALNRLQMSPAVRLQDKLSTPLRNIEGKMKALGNRVVTIGIKAKDMTRGVLSKLASPLGLLGMGALAAGPVMLAASGVGKAMDFEEQMSSIQALASLSNRETEMMSSLALKMGAKTKYNALEAAQGIEELVKAGISPAAVKSGALEAALNLAAAGGLGLADAATVMSTALNAFKEDNMTAAQASNILAGTANASAADVSDLRMALSMTSAVASMAGMSFKDTNIALGKMANAGLRGSDAGTSLKTMLMNLIPKTKLQATQFEKLGLATKNGGNQFFTAAGKMKPLREIAEVMKKSFQGMTQEQRLSAMEIAFGTDAIRAASILYKAGAIGIDDFNKAMSKVTALDVAKKKMDNAKGAVEQFRGALETMQIAGLMPMMPLIKDFALWMADMAEKYTPAVVKATKGMAANIKRYFDVLFSDKVFAKMGFGDKIAFVMNQGIDSMDKWVSGEGGAKVQSIFSKLAEIGVKAWFGVMRNLANRSFDELLGKEPPQPPTQIIRDRPLSVRESVNPVLERRQQPESRTLKSRVIGAVTPAATAYVLGGGFALGLAFKAAKLLKDAGQGLLNTGTRVASKLATKAAKGVPVAAEVTGVSKAAATTTKTTGLVSVVTKPPTATRVKAEKPLMLLEKKITPAERKSWVPFEEMQELKNPAARAAARMRAGQTPIVGSVAKVAESARVATKSLNPLTRIFGAVGKTALKALVPLALFMTALNISKADAAERNKVIGGEAGGWGGSLGAGGAGAAIGTAIFPGIGTAIGGILGAIGGGIAGTALGEKIGANFDNIKAIVHDKFAQIKVGATTGAEATRDKVTSVFDSLAASTESSFGKIPGIVSSRLSQTRIIAHDQTAQTATDMAAQWESVYNSVNTWAASSYASVARWFGGISGAVGAGISAAASVVELAGASLRTNPPPASPKIIAHARGGIFTQPHVGLFAEAGPEALIPLAPAQRARAYNIWQQTGERLGIRPYAMGGFTDARPATTAIRDRAAVHKIFQQSNLELTREGLTERLIQPVYSQGQSRDSGSSGNYTSPLPAGRPTSTTTTIHINMAEAVRTIQVNNQGDMDAAADKAAAIVAKQLRTVLSNLA